MNRYCQAYRLLAFRVPRIRGDEPQFVNGLAIESGCSPHPRG